MGWFDEMEWAQRRSINKSEIHFNLLFRMGRLIEFPLLKSNGAPRRKQSINSISLIINEMSELM